ncbi:hypothetical protein B0H10DRAFT_2219536 [Mycena sp. CBHHK59/15]|nr:hypothetical protein B0H10DRAFT_2219536 [Mycena sp. CBHHK59/15]
MATTVASIIPYKAPDYPFDFRDAADIARHREALQETRVLALRDKLTEGLRFTFDLKIPASNPDSQSRPLPSVPRNPHDSTTARVSLRLDRQLQPGLDMYSQVWTGLLDSPHGPATNDSDTCFVLKIIQASICMLPPGEDDEKWSLSPYQNPANLAHREAWVYENLTQRQGLSIPYFFGLHTIVTPSMEQAWVLIFEYINGQTLAEYQTAPGHSFEDTCDILKIALTAISDLVSCRFMHGDTGGTNFLICGLPGARSVVFIDFFSALLVDPQEVERVRDVATWEFNGTFIGHVEIDYRVAVFNWVKANLPARVWS